MADWHVAGGGTSEVSITALLVDTTAGDVVVVIVQLVGAAVVLFMAVGVYVALSRTYEEWRQGHKDSLRGELYAEADDKAAQAAALSASLLKRLEDERRKVAELESRLRIHGEGAPIGECVSCGASEWRPVLYELSSPVDPNIATVLERGDAELGALELGPQTKWRCRRCGVGVA